MLNRKQRIAIAQKEVNSLKPKFDQIDVEYDQAKVNLKREIDSYDIGEKVILEQTCKRGCCVEFEGEGIIVAKTDNRCYNIKMNKDGVIHTYCSEFDMKRVVKDKKVIDACVYDDM